MTEPAYHRPNTPQRSLWDTLPTKTFVRLDTLRSLDLSHTTVLYKTRPALRDSLVEGESLVDLPFGTVHSLTCLGISIGYQLVMPKCTVRVGPNFVTFALRESPQGEVERILSTRDVAILGNTQALLVVSSRRYWTLTGDGA